MKSSLNFSRNNSSKMVPDEDVIKKFTEAELKKAQKVDAINANAINAPSNFYQSKIITSNDFNPNASQYNPSINVKTTLSRSLTSRLTIDLINNETSTEFLLERKGEVDKAKIHANANRPLHKIDEFNDNTVFCICCNLPCEQKGVIEKYNECEDSENYAQCGEGTFLYFYYFWFNIIVTFSLLFLGGLQFIIINGEVAENIKNFCYNLERKNVDMKLYNQTYYHCKNYIECKDRNNDTYWLSVFSSDNIKVYKNISAILIENSKENSIVNLTFEENIYDTICDYNVLIFIYMVAIFVFNMLEINYLKIENQLFNLTTISPSNYSLLISNLSSIKEKFKKFKAKSKSESFLMKTEQEQLKEFIRKHVIERLIPANLQKKIVIDAINIAYKINEFLDLQEKLQDRRYKIFQVYYNPRQVEKNKADKRNKRRNKLYYYSPFEDCGFYCCMENKGIALEELIKQRKSYHLRLQNLLETTETQAAEKFAGCIFVTFKTIKQKELFYNLFPQSFVGAFWKYITDLDYYCDCASESDPDYLKKKNKMTVNLPPEPDDVIWENLEYTAWYRFKCTVVVYLLTLLLICMNFGLVFPLTILQNKIQDEKRQNSKVKYYVISLVISIVIAIFDEFFKVFFGFLTKYEKQISMTDNYLSLSIKLTVFSFISSAIVPLLSSMVALADKWTRNENIINNMFVHFLINSFLLPTLWTLNPFYFLKLIRIKFLDEEHHNKTQKELNELYELMDMQIAYKYSYITKTILIALFYSSLLPLGVPISLCGLIYGYFLEKYNISNRYKRIEMINDQMCIFYVDYYCIVLFILTVGNLIFFNGAFSKLWATINVVFTAFMMLFPYTFVIKSHHNFLDALSFNDESMDEVRYTFYNDYERQNPITKKEGLVKFLSGLRRERLISGEEYTKFYNVVMNLNIMEIYYKYRNKYSLMKNQATLANIRNTQVGSQFDALCQRNPGLTNFYASKFRSVKPQSNEHQETNPFRKANIGAILRESIYNRNDNFRKSLTKFARSNVVNDFGEQVNMKESLEDSEQDDTRKTATFKRSVSNEAAINLKTESRVTEEQLQEAVRKSTLPMYRNPLMLNMGFAIGNEPSAFDNDYQEDIYDDRRFGNIYNFNNRIVERSFEYSKCGSPIHSDKNSCPFSVVNTFKAETIAKEQSIPSINACDNTNDYLNKNDLSKSVSARQKLYSSANDNNIYFKRKRPFRISFSYAANKDKI